MAYDYALVHLKYTIPLAGLLTFILKPLLTRQDLYKTLALIFIAFTATLPWDSYLIRHGVWTYPPDAIIGPRLYGVPAEELFFFIIQTYITSMTYILMNKPVLHAQYLTNKKDSSKAVRWTRVLGQVFLVSCFAAGVSLVREGDEGTYLGLILVWACPFALLTWTCSGYFLLCLPLMSTAFPIIIPTLFLWIVDELALGRGTWSIESGTKLGWCIFGSLELEEAVFFLATNSLIVLGLTAFNRGLAVSDTFPELFQTFREVYAYEGARTSLKILVRAVLTNPSNYNMERVVGIREAVARLKSKSRSFYLASSVFPGRLRIDLIALYSFCRVADDLVDNSQTEAEALEWINKLAKYLDIIYARNGSANSPSNVARWIDENFPDSTRSALNLLPASLLPSQPFRELLEGFKMDLSFSHISNDQGLLHQDKYPIRNVQDLELYASRVASTVGELCLHLVIHHSNTQLSINDKEILIKASQTMGLALQYVNIARDITVDANMGRVYLPTTWLKDEDLTPYDIIKAPREPSVDKLREKLLNVAFEEYARSRPQMSMLPKDVRGPLIVAVESYMEIGRVLRENKGVPSPSRPGRATVPKWRRIWVAWNVLSTQ